jgi:predicted nucleic acid-binding protein
LKLLADTSALLALVLRDDQNHAGAVEFLRRNPSARFVLTDLVLGELATRVRVRAGAARAVAIARDLLRSRRYEVLFVDVGLAESALLSMERFADKGLSFTDCASFEIMRQLGIKQAFTFDRDFRDCGFAMLP